MQRITILDGRDHRAVPPRARHGDGRGAVVQIGAEAAQDPGQAQQGADSAAHQIIAVDAGTATDNGLRRRSVVTLIDAQQFDLACQAVEQINDIATDAVALADSGRDVNRDAQKRDVVHGEASPPRRALAMA